MKMTRKDLAKLATIIGVVLATAGFAARAAADNDDPSSRVARLASAQGAVSFQPAGTDDWVTAGVNRPITTGDKLWSDSDGRSELQLDGSLIRLSNNTGMSFLNLGDRMTQIQLSSGTLFVRLRRLDDDETYEIDTPNLAFSVLRPGLYRISVNENGDATAIKISTGQGAVTGGGSAYTVHANESVTFSGTDQLNAYAENYDRNRNDYNNNDEDQFETWSANRDRHLQHSSSARYVSADVVGYEDLDDHGSWRQTRENGYVWFPRTTERDWAPYHNGHWAYIEPWGYTWVDNEPWGFAPFHYGRWVSYEGSWGWVPAAPRREGVEYVRPVYAPALVAWVGGPHFAIGIGVGGGGGRGGEDRYASGVSVGWFPLGPREVYVPSYRVSRNYVNNVNVSNTTVNTTVVNNYYNTTVVNNNVNVTNVKYVNQSVPGAVAATTPQAFTSAQSVSKNAVKVDQREVASAPVRAFTPPVAPAKQAVLGTATAAAKPPTAVETRAVVVKVAPPPPPPAFEKRQEAIKSNGGKPLSVAQVQQIQPVVARAAAPVKIAPPAAAKVVTPQAAVPPANRPGAAQNEPPQSGKPVQQVAPNANGKPPEPANRPANANGAPQAGVPSANRPAVNNEPPAATPSGARPPDRPAPPNNGNPPANKPAAPPERPGDRPGIPNSGNTQTSKPVEPVVAEPTNRRADRPPDRPANSNNSAQPPQNNRPVAPNNAPPAPSVARPPDRPSDRPTTPNAANPPANRPTTQDTPNRPNNAAQPPQNNRPVSAPAVHPNENPAPHRPVVQPSANAELDRKHQQEQDQLHAKQEQERQRTQQAQEQEHAKLAQQQADQGKKQQVEQQHQQQTQQLQQKHADEQKQLQGKQQQEKQKKAKPEKGDRPPDAKP